MVKKIVICCDGTWNTPDQRAPTNVARIAEAVRPADAEGREQRTFYHRGVGTNGWDRLIGGVFGFGLSRNVRDAYRFVVENYTPGDELFFFGFSRGAYTVRSVVGFIRNCGILRPEFADKVDEAYALYRNRKDRTRPAAAEAKRFRSAYSQEAPIRFLGVWDTVGALGIPLSGLRLINLFNRRFQFHDTELSRNVEAAFQSLAIDERRRPFRPAVWRKHPLADGQQVEQMWFSGVHSDVGGGYPERELADIAMAWMVERARACGLALDVDTVAPDPFGKLHDSMSFLYRLLGPYERWLNHTDPLQCLASTAYKRHEQLPKEYSPDNLVNYLRADGPVKDV
ncbi:DUF2235 domain-containing protein [Amycolatopsis taiwanensis]|uniref:T6SS Phospholipase effector Tle1-like catalytic domain-containing protein n=1 Tax=Amycolatopsis taiwanensis TaxID=342230 RepID=A0A9W6QYH7_9PSEU|nr:DUF2235 domain-containing protein [Amycolatopsis taiwanensis]GLY64382.1 hypothetical protein Atai01_10010 [Amycolatopsis taiwanensis]